MSTNAFKPKAYVKEGCPFSFKFLTFINDAGLKDQFDVIRLREGTPEYEQAKQQVGERLGKPMTFPTVEIEPGRYMTDSDQLIEHYAQRHGVRVDELPVLSFYKQTILPKLFELHKLKTGKA